MTYLVRVTSTHKPQLALTEELSVRHPRKTKYKRMLGPFREVEDAGEIKSRFQIGCIGADRDADGEREGSATFANGRAASRRDQVWVEATAAGIKKGVRRLREQEAAAIEAIDEEIAELNRRMKAARDARVEAVKIAWQKANVVRLKEVEAAAEATVKRDAEWRLRHP